MRVRPVFIEAENEAKATKFGLEVILATSIKSDSNAISNHFHFIGQKDK